MFADKASNLYRFIKAEQNKLENNSETYIRNLPEQ